MRGVVAQHRDPVVSGVEDARQQLLQARVRHAGVVGQKLLPGLQQLPAELLLMGELDGGEDGGSEEQVERVTGGHEPEEEAGARHPPAPRRAQVKQEQEQEQRPGLDLHLIPDSPSSYLHLWRGRRR